MYINTKKIRGCKLMSALTCFILMSGFQSLKAQGSGQTGPFSIWNETSVPAILADPDPSAIELGVKFRPLVNGYITGIRYYKSESNTGTHVGSLWSSAGVLLAQATFTDETTTGWQQVIFSNPVAVTANTTYVASYHTSTGHYSFDAGYFATAVSTPYLEALTSSAENPNGVYKLAASSVFPDLPTFNAGNVWVDVLFMTSLGMDNIPPSVISTEPANSSTGVPTTSSIKASFNEAIDPATISNVTMELRSSSNELIPAGISYNSISYTASLIPSSPLTNSTIYTLTLKGGSSDPGVKDFAGNPLAGNFTMSFTTADQVQVSSQNITFNAPANKTFGDPPFNVSATASSGLQVTLSIVSGPATINGNTVTLSGAGEVTVMATQSGDSMYEPADPVSRTFTVFEAASEPGPLSIWSPTTIPGIIADPDASAIELGVKFRPLVNGYITGIRYYKSESNTGSHVGSLWSPEGVRLAQATFSNESQSGWQQVLFDTPVAIAAGTIYVASYHTSTGHYSFDPNYFLSAVSTPFLEALAATPGNPNGVFKPSASSTFPDLPIMNSGNAWVDVIFMTSLPADTSPPIITSTIPGDNSTGVLPVTLITVAFNEAIDPESVNLNTVELRNASDAPVPAIVSYDPASLTATLAPSANLANSTTYTLRVKGGTSEPAIKDIAGNALLSDVITGFTTADALSQTISFDALINKTYGNAPFTVSATASSGLPVSFSISSGPATLNGSTISITGAGDVTVTASQGGNDQFSAAVPVSRTFTVGKAEQVITWENPPAIQTGTPLSATQLNATVAGVNGDLTLGALTYSPAIATILTAGTHVLSVTAAATNNYNEASKTVSLIVTTSNQTISFDALINKTYGNAPFTVSATASSGLPVSFSISSGPATLSGSTISITGAGDVTVTASQGGNDQFSAAEPVSRTFTVGKAEQVITWENPPALQAGTPLSATQLNATVAGVNGDLTLGALTYSPAIATILTAGTHVLSVTAAATNNYNEASKTVSLIVTTSNQTISFDALINKTYGNAPFTVSASASSGLPVSFSISSGPATLSGSTISITGAGDVTVTASQGGNDQFSAAEPVSRTFTVGKAEQVITWENPPAIQAGTPLSTTQLNATVAGVNGDLALGALTYSPAIATILTAGTHVLSVTAAATNNYNEASKTVSLIVTTSNQTISFDALSNKTYGNAPFTVSATASSALPVSFSISSGPATLSGSTISITGAGDVTVTASQGGNGQFSAAVPVSRTFTVGKAEQVITWENPPAIQAGTPLSATQLNATVAGVNGDLTLGALTYSPAIATILTAGTHVLSVTAAATNNYNEASKTVSLIVTTSNQTISFDALINKTYGNAPFTVSASASSGLPVSFSISSGPATLSGSTISITGAGDVTVTASQGGNDQFSAAVPVSRTFTVGKAEQVITWENPSAIQAGTPLSTTQLNATVAGVNGDLTLGALTYSPATGTILTAGTHILSVTAAATNNYNEASKTVSINVSPPPASLTAIIRINSGGPNIQLGNESWVSDRYFTGGNLYKTTSAISNTSNDALYQTERYGNITYNIPVPQAGKYTVDLHLAELYHNVSGARIFNVNIESGQFQLQNIDLFRNYGGKFAASTIKAQNVQVNDGFITIVFTRIIDYAKISGVAVFLQSENTPVNNPPVLSKPADVSLSSGQSWTYQVIASDPNAGDVLTYTATNLPASLNLNTSTGMISGNVTATAASYTVNLSVRDQQNLTASTSFVITVNAIANRAPVISKPADVTLTSGQSWNYQVIASDPDAGAVLTYSASNLPASLNLNASTGVISGNITASATSYTVNLSVRDQQNLTASTSFVLTVNAIANRAPVISRPADITLTSGQTWNYQVIASDPDAGAILTYSATNLPGSLTLNTSTGLISGSISAAAGSYSIGLSVRDQQNLSANTSFVITIGSSGNLTNVVRINSGGPNIQLGNESWVSDRYFTGGSIYKTTSAISNTSNDALYQTERYGNITYNIPVPQTGRYTVDLHLAELYHNSSGARIFNVNIESGQFQLQNIDLFKDYGGKFAASVIRAQNVQVNDGFITIVFTRVIDYAKISGIAVFLQPAENPAIIQSTGSNNSVAMTNTRITSENSGKTMLFKEPAMAQKIRLRAYPNPFGKHAMITFTLPADEEMVILDVFDLKGRRIKRLFEGKAQAGQVMEFAFDGSNLSAGIYLLRLSTSSKLENLRIIMTE